MNSLLSRYGYSIGSGVEDNRVECVEFLTHEFGSELESALGFDNVDAQEDYDGYDDFYIHADRDRDDVYSGGSEQYSTVSEELGNLRDDTSCIHRFVSYSDLDIENTALGMDKSSNVFGFDHDEDNVRVPFDLEPLVVDNDVGLGWEEVNDGGVQFIDMGMQLAEDGNDDSASIGGGEIVVDMAWQVLSNVSNFGVMSPEHGEEFVRSFYRDDDFFMDTADYNTMLDQFVENVNALLGLPPASTNVVNNLHEVNIGEADLENGNVVVCAVCKEEMTVGGKAKQLPCGHRYHGDCILPWLAIRNTCPVCRHALPTDNAEYEARMALLRARQTM